MIRRRIMPALSGFVFILIINWSCTKIDTTTLGSDLLPVVDNVNTFASPFNVVAYQGVFNDTTTLGRSEDLILGKITNDPEFGQTQANIYVQFKPENYPYSITSTGDTLEGIDSVVLTLAYRGSWGDTTATAPPLKLNVKEIPRNTGLAWDSLYKRKPITYAPPTDQLLASKVIDVRRLNERTYFNRGKDSVVGQIRIKLDNSFITKILEQDSAAVTRIALGYVSNAFYKDSIFRENFEGLGIEAETGDALMRIKLTDPKSRLEIHFRKRRNLVKDTTYTTWNFINNEFQRVPSAYANKIVRTTPFNFPVPPVPADIIYLQTTPGTFAELKIPELSNFNDTNRIIHLAQLRIIQVPGDLLSDQKFTVPDYLYLDLRDTTTGSVVKYKPIYFDLNPSIRYNPDNVPTGSFYPRQVEFGYFGGFRKTMTDPNGGRQIAYYDFNITRYVQQMVIQNSTNYDLRLFAPYSFSYPQYSAEIINYPNNLAHGRVKVGGSNGNYKMQLKIIWSKVKVP